MCTEYSLFCNYTVRRTDLKNAGTTENLKVFKIGQQRETIKYTVTRISSESNLKHRKQLVGGEDNDMHYQTFQLVAYFFQDIAMPPHLFLAARDILGN